MGNSFLCEKGTKTMNSFKRFLKDKGLYLTCLALILAAAITSIWAIRSVVHNVSDYTKAKQQAEEGSTWNSPQAEVQQPVTDVPKPTSAPSAESSASSSLSGASSASSGAQDGSGASAGSSTRQSTSVAAPVDGKILQAYSGDELVYNETLGDWRTHNGIDYSCEANEKVVACRSGSVTGTSEDALWGGVVELTDDDGVIWRYCGLAEPAVTSGEKIAAGQTLGRAKDVPAEEWEGVHLHLECKKGDAWLDPAVLLSGKNS
jgi:murein DD-endopeptidase MepM/ murein hydrolase activator NlpD